MSLFDDLSRLINDTVGNNMNNDEDDVRKTKENFSRIGRYEDPVENGIIDRELDSAIWDFQRDNDLKQDGFMAPRGETEQALQRELREKDTDDEMQMAGLGMLAPALAPTARALSIISKNLKHNKNKTKNRDRVDGVVGVTSDFYPDEDDYCYENYLDEVQICKRLKTANKKAVCYASAADRLGSCRAGKPEESWPPLRR